MYAMNETGHRRATRGMLDLRAPEDRLAFDEPISRSPSVDRWIDAYFDADLEGDDQGRRIALKGVVDAHRADHAAAGVPIYAHPPLPADFVDEVIAATGTLPLHHRNGALNAFMFELEPSAKPAVAQQLDAQMAARPSFRPMSQRTDDPDSPAARKKSEDLNARDPIAAAAHPLAYGGDAAMDDLFGKNGLFGDWGWRRKIPKPGGTVSGTLGELARLYLGTGPLTVGRLGRVGQGARGTLKGSSAKPPPSGPRTSKEMARPYNSHTKCNCHPLNRDAKCPSRVEGYGTGPNRAISCRMGWEAAQAQVPEGCQAKHCRCRRTN